MIVLSGAAASALPAQPGAAASAAHAVLPPGREVAERHVEAVGGRAALERLESRRVWARFEVLEERLSGQIEIFGARPNKLLVRATYSDMATSVTGFDGRTGWSSPPGGRLELLNGDRLVEVADGALFDHDLRDAAEYRVMETLQRVEFEGRPCYRVRVVRASGRELIEFFDVQTGLFAGSIARRATDKGSVTVRTVIRRYMTVDGVRVPARISVRSGGVEQIITVMRVRHNDVDMKVFEIPRQLRDRAARSS